MTARQRRCPPGRRHSSSAHDHQPRPVAQFPDTRLKAVVICFFPSLNLGLNDSFSDRFIESERSPDCQAGEQHEQPQPDPSQRSLAHEMRRYGILHVNAKSAEGLLPGALHASSTRGVHLGRSHGWSPSVIFSEFMTTKRTESSISELVQ